MFYMTNETIKPVDNSNNTKNMSSRVNFGDGEFEFISNSYQDLYKNMHNAITSTELWEWMRDFEPKEGKGFMFSSLPELDRIQNKMSEDPISGNHSGASYGRMMRHMQYIAKSGYDKFKADYIAANSRIELL